MARCSNLFERGVVKDVIRNIVNGLFDGFIKTSHKFVLIGQIQQGRLNNFPDQFHQFQLGHKTVALGIDALHLYNHFKIHTQAGH